MKCICCNREMGEAPTHFKIMKNVCILCKHKNMENRRLRKEGVEPQLQKIERVILSRPLPDFCSSEVIA